MQRYLIAIDYQNDFVSASLAFPDAELLDSLIAEKIKKYNSTCCIWNKGAIFEKMQRISW